MTQLPDKNIVSGPLPRRWTQCQQHIEAGSDMGSQHDQRRLGTASATISAGTLIFFAAGAGPATAATHTADCKLGTLLCGVLGGGTTSKPTTPTKPTTSTKPEPKPKPKP